MKTTLILGWVIVGSVFFDSVFLGSVNFPPVFLVLVILASLA
jgi:hypothetical protein